MGEMSAPEVTVAQCGLQVRRRKISSCFNSLLPECGPDFVAVLPAEAAPQQHRISKPAYTALAWAVSKATDVLTRLELRCVASG